MLDPYIVKHCINTWNDVAPVHQNKQPIHPSKALTVKVEIKNLHKAGFI